MTLLAHHIDRCVRTQALFGNGFENNFLFPKTKSTLFSKLLTNNSKQKTVFKCESHKKKKKKTFQNYYQTYFVTHRSVLTLISVDLYPVICLVLLLFLHFLYDLEVLRYILGLAPALRDHTLIKPSSSKFLSLQGTALQKLQSLRSLYKVDLAANMLV